MVLKHGISIPLSHTKRPLPVIPDERPSSAIPDILPVIPDKRPLLSFPTKGPSCHFQQKSPSAIPDTPPVIPDVSNRESRVFLAGRFLH